MSILGVIYGVLLSFTGVAQSAEINATSTPFTWQQVEPTLTFHFFLERELYTSLDRSVRMVFAVESELAGQSPAELAARWTISDDSLVIARGDASLAQGGNDVTFALSQLQPGNYTVAAQLLKGDEVLAEKSASLRYEQRDAPPAAGGINLQLPRGMPLEGRTWPVHAGVPFPKGALWNAANVRVVDASGREVDADVVVRGRWGNSEQSSIRWLGVEFAPGAARADWPTAHPGYRLEYGPQVSRATPATTIQATDDATGITIDTGAATFQIARKNFNVINRWKAGEQTFRSSSRHGLYVVDHKGTIYRAANDRDVDLKIEEQSAMHVVVRAAGWYVKDRAANPPTQELTLPTDKLCRFITRIEAYAGQPYVRVTNTLIITFDTFEVQLRDAGMSLPAFGTTQAVFGVEEGSPVVAAVSPRGGARGVQHLHNAFTIEDGQGKSFAESTHSAGWVIASGGSGSLSMCLRDTWQRYPKEFEVLADAIKLHVWPAHGREHPEIDELARNQMHKLLFAHQGDELHMNTPWDYFTAACDYYNMDSFDVYKPTGHVISAVYGSGLGVATTSDVLLQLGAVDDQAQLVANAECFKLAPHAVADPKWTCDSLALGYINPYDPAKFPIIEQVISDAMRGYWKYQDMGEMFGMWIYRSWLHSGYRGDGAWELYRLYNGTHHQEAIIPWLLYARSGDPFYLTQGMANIRQLTDVQMSHHADDRTSYKQFWSSQKPLVGSTMHDDCLTPWGNDHAILGHLCCYNASIVSYYLTGDLRLREVVVDEWQNTLLTQRDTWSYQAADRSKTAYSQIPRDNSNAIGEILDAYQLTYDPRLLSLLAPRWDIWVNSPGCMGVDWGQPVHNELLFRGSAIVKEKLLAGAALLREDKSDYSLAIARPTSAPQELFAMAGIVDPSESWAFDAVYAADLHQLLTWSTNRITMKVNDLFYSTGENILYMPRMMYALAHSSRPEAARILGLGQPAPRAPGASTRVVVREDVDQTFSVYFHGDVKQKDGFGIQVFNPAGAPVATKHVDAGMQTVELAVPSDGMTGEYVLFIDARQVDNCYAPFTALPEVYVTGFWTGQFGLSCYFTRSAEGTSEMTFTPHQGPGVILSGDKQATVAATDTGEAMAVTVGTDGVWVWNRSGYIAGSRGGDRPAILSSTPQRWFMPNEKSLTLSPVN